MSRTKTLGAAFILLGALLLAQAPGRVRVMIDNADIRSAPAISAEILAVAVKGALYEVVEHADAWYAIRMGLDETGQAIHGYIHESMVEPSGEPTAPQVRAEPPPVAQPQRVPPPPPTPIREPPPPQWEEQVARTKVRSHDKLVSGSFIKYGFGDHWLASFGFDLGIGRHLGIGLELQPYFTNLSAIDRTVIQMDIFANLKLGFKLWVLTLYGGGGIGPDLSYTSTEVEGRTVAELRTMLAAHGIAGLAVNIGKIALIFEYQPVMVSDPVIDPDIWGHFFFVGLRF